MLEDSNDWASIRDYVKSKTMVLLKWILNGYFFPTKPTSPRI
jgi:hypothetical protein